MATKKQKVAAAEEAEAEEGAMEKVAVAVIVALGAMAVATRAVG